MPAERIPLRRLGDGLFHASGHALCGDHRPAAGRAAGHGGEEGHPPAPVLADGFPERPDQPAAFDPVHHPDGHDHPADPRHRRNVPGHGGVHRSADGRGVPVHRAPGGEQPAGGQPQYH